MGNLLIISHPGSFTEAGKVGRRLVLSAALLLGICRDRPIQVDQVTHLPGPRPTTRFDRLSQNVTKSRKQPARQESILSRMDFTPDLSISTAYTRIGRSPIHGRGLFAALEIPAGSYLGTYEGEQTDRDGCYVLWVENEARDGAYGVRGRNSMRFVNHSDRPNAEFDAEKLHALRRIHPSEEITVDYGPDWAE